MLWSSYFSESRFKTKTMFGCHHLNPDLRLKPCLVVIMMTTKLLRTPNLPLVPLFWSPKLTPNFVLPLTKNSVSRLVYRALSSSWLEPKSLSWDGLASARRLAVQRTGLPLGDLSRNYASFAKSVAFKSSFCIRSCLFEKQSRLWCLYGSSKK